MKTATGKVRAAIDGATLKATAEVYSPLPDDHPYHAKIGRIITICAQIEYILDRTSWHLKGETDAAGHARTSKIAGVQTRADALVKDVKRNHPPQGVLDLAQWLQKNAQPRFDVRNTLSHAAWYQGKSGNIKQAGGGKKQPYGFRDVPDHSFDDAMRNLREVLSKANDLFAAVNR